MKVVALIAMSGYMAGSALGGIADFFVADGQGGIYSVNGQTLAASQVFTIDGGLAINDIIFVGDNKMLANVTDQLIQYDMTTGVETVIFDTDGLSAKDGVYFIAGFAGTASNDIFISARRFTEDGNDFFGATYNPITGTYTEGAALEESVSGLYFDHLEVGENLYLGADYGNGLIHVINSVTGQDVAIYDAAHAPVSFLELDGQIFSMSGEGELFTFDLDTGDSVFFGEISGVSASLLGATNTQVFRIPAPGTLPAFGLVSFIVARRRRS